MVKNAIYEFTHNLDGKYSQAQIDILYDLPSAETLRTNKNIKVFAVNPRIYDIEINNSLTKDDYIRKGVIKWMQEWHRYVLKK